MPATPLADTRDRIVTSALHLAGQRRAFQPLRAIADDVGVSLGTLSTYFATRSDLIKAVERKAIATVWRELRRTGTFDGAALVCALRTSDGVAQMLLDHGRALPNWPPRLAGRFATDLSQADAQMVMFDLMATLAYLAGCYDDELVPPLSTTEADALHTAIATIYRSPAVASPDVDELPNIADDIDHHLAATDEPRRNHTVERPTVRASVETLLAGSRITAREIRRRLGSGMSRLYERHTMADLYLELDRVLFASTIGRVATLDQLIGHGQRAIVGAARFPTLMEYIVKKSTTENSEVEDLFDRIIATQRANGTMRFTELTDKHHRAMIIGTVTQRFRSRQSHPQPWAELGGHFERMRDALQHPPH